MSFLDEPFSISAVQQRANEALTLFRRKHASLFQPETPEREIVVALAPWFRHTFDGWLVETWPDDHRHRPVAARLGPLYEKKGVAATSYLPDLVLLHPRRAARLLVVEVSCSAAPDLSHKLDLAKVQAYFQADLGYRLGLHLRVDTAQRYGQRLLTLWLIGRPTRAGWR